MEIPDRGISIGRLLGIALAHPTTRQTQLVAGSFRDTGARWRRMHFRQATRAPAPSARPARDEHHVRRRVVELAHPARHLELGLGRGKCPVTAPGGPAPPRHGTGGTPPLSRPPKFRDPPREVRPIFENAFRYMRRVFSAVGEESVAGAVGGPDPAGKSFPPEPRLVRFDS